MKNIGFIVVFTLLTSLGFGQKAVEVTFDKESIALGTVKKGEKKHLEYHFTNTGTDVIEIDLVSSCECTKLEWTRGKIKPGEKGSIKATFDSSSKDKSESISVEMYLTNIDPRIDANYLYMLEYTYELAK